MPAMYTKPTLFLLALLLLVGSASANEFVNGDFSSGTTGWSGYKYSVDSGQLKLGDSSKGDGYAYQTIHNVNGGTLTFYMMSGVNGRMVMTTNGNTRVIINGFGYGTYNVDMTGYSGDVVVRVQNYIIAAGGSYGYADNFFYEAPEPESYLYFDGSSSNQNWYINDTYLPFGVTRDGIIDYEIGSFDSDKIYMINDTSGTWDWTIDDDNGISSDNGIHSRLRYMVHLPYETSLDTYTFTLWEVDGVEKPDIPWYLIFIEPLEWLIYHFSDSTPTYTELDTITITLHAVNQTAPDDLPEYLPEEDPLDLPEYNSTVPLPDVPDQPTNESLGGNYSGEFRESAEGIIGQATNGTSGTVGFLLSPVTSLTVYVNYANATLAESYLSANSSQPVLIAIVPPLINAIPEKVQKYITFVLVLHLVLILLRWK